MNEISWQWGLILWGIIFVICWALVEIIYVMRGPDNNEREEDWLAERRRRIQRRGNGNIWGKRD